MSGGIISRQLREIKIGRIAAFVKRLSPPFWGIHIPRDRANQAKSECLRSAVTAWLSK